MLQFFSLNETLSNNVDDADILLTGEVISVGDGIVYISGLEEIESGAVVNIESS